MEHQGFFTPKKGEFPAKRRSGYSWISWYMLITHAAMGKRCVYASPNRERWDQMVANTLKNHKAFTSESAGDILRHESGGSIALWVPGAEEGGGQ